MEGLLGPGAGNSICIEHVYVILPTSNWQRILVGSPRVERAVFFLGVTSKAGASATLAQERPLSMRGAPLGVVF